MSDHVGDPVEPRCPSCGGPCVYNGNYFCLDADCGWALPCNEDGGHHPHQLWFEHAHESLMEYRGRKAEKKR